MFAFPKKEKKEKLKKKRKRRRRRVTKPLNVPLYNRVQEAQEILHKRREEAKQLREQKEMKECTFVPDISASNNRREGGSRAKERYFSPNSFFEREQNQLQLRAKWIAEQKEIKRQQEEKEFASFGTAGIISQNDAENFYRRNIKWQKENMHKRCSEQHRLALQKLNACTFAPKINNYIPPATSTRSKLQESRNETFWLTKKMMAESKGLRTDSTTHEKNRVSVSEGQVTMPTPLKTNSPSPEQALLPEESREEEDTPLSTADLPSQEPQPDALHVEKEGRNSPTTPQAEEHLRQQMLLRNTISELSQSFSRSPGKGESQVSVESQSAHVSCHILKEALAQVEAEYTRIREENDMIQQGMKMLRNSKR